MLPPAPVTITRPPGDVLGDGVQVGLDLVPTEEVLVGEIADVADPDHTQHLAYGGKHLDGEAGRDGEVADLGDLLAGRRRDGDQHRLGARSLGCSLDLAAVTDDRNAPNRQALAIRVVVEDPHGHVGRLACPHERGDDLQTALTGTEHEQLLGGV